VWHDQTDLPPGDTNQRLEEALGQGLSGAVLIVTPDIANSPAVKEIEAPHLIALSQQTDFALWVANAVAFDGNPNYSAPDDLLGLPSGTLKGVLQVSPNTDDGVSRILNSMLRNRLQRAATTIRDSGGVLSMRVQTRAAPSAFEDRPETLQIRLRPNASGRLPSVEGLRYLQSALPELYDTGGGHLSVALALGAALPSTLIGRASVIDPGGNEWVGPTMAFAPETAMLTEVVNRPGPANTGQVAVYLDLVPGQDDQPFYAYVAAEAAQFSAVLHLRPVSPGPIGPADSEEFVAETAQRIRSLRSQHGGAEVHLFLLTPFTVAFLVGRLMNTVRVVAYEFDGQRYVASLRLRDTAVGGAVEDVLLTESNGEHQ
jgi:hypothetical protein